MPSGPNGSRQVFTSEQVWRKYDAVEGRLTASVSERMLDLAGLQPGMRVLDLATGRGEPALRAARRVGAGGLVVGIEPSAGVLEIAKEQAARDGIANVDFRVAQAEALGDLSLGQFNAVTSRWGLMYFTEPVSVLMHARQALLPSGVLVAAMLAEAERMPWYSLPRRLLAVYRPLPPVDPEAPGPLRFAALERIARDFDRAGFDIDHVEEMDVPVFESESAAEVVEWARVFGLTTLLNEVPDDAQRSWAEDLAAAVEATRENGLLRLGGVTRLVRGRPRSVYGKSR